MPNRSKIVLDLVDVFGKRIKDTVHVQLRNQSLASLNQEVKDAPFKGAAPVTIKNVPAFPNGLAEMTIKPKKYALKAVFVNVPAGEPLVVRDTMFVNAARVAAEFPAVAALPDDVRRLLRKSGVAWGDLEDQQRAGLMNICAKCRAETLAPGKTVADCLVKVIEFRPERIFVTVDATLHSLVLAQPEQFNPVSGALHTFPDGFRMLTEKASFKTPDPAGNLQLTFARDTGGEGTTLVDVDLDDHSGIQHAFDVLKHKLTGTDTHPFNIHQILMHFQGIDAGYRLS